MNDNFLDYSKYIINTPKDGGEYYGLSIPVDVTPPKKGQVLNLGGTKVIAFSISTPDDIRKGRGGPVADSMEKYGIGWRVNCLPEGHEYLKRANEKISSISILLDTTAGQLEALGRVKEAFQVDRVADAWEEFLKTQKATPGAPVTKETLFPKIPVKKLLWGSGDKRLQTVKDALENIVRRRKGVNIPREKLVDIENILKDLRRISITEFANQAEIDVAKKQIYDKAFSIDPTISELIGLLFAPIANKMERMHNENEINRLAKPFLFQEGNKDPFQNEIGQSDFGRSRIFQEMARRANSLDLSGLSEDHVKMVNACLSVF